MPNDIVKRLDGKYEQQLGGRWLAEYFEDAQTGLWHVEVFLSDVVEWNAMDIPSLDEAQQAAQTYVVQHTE